MGWMENGRRPNRRLVGRKDDDSQMGRRTDCWTAKRPAGQMAGKTDGQRNRRNDKWTNGEMDGWMAGEIAGRADRRIAGRLGQWPTVQTDGEPDRWTDGRADKRMDRTLNTDRTQTEHGQNTDGTGMEDRQWVEKRYKMKLAATICLAEILQSE